MGLEPSEKTVCCVQGPCNIEQVVEASPSNKLTIHNYYIIVAVSCFRLEPRRAGVRGCGGGARFAPPPPANTRGEMCKHQRNYPELCL